jgi:hypothetical protein
MTIFKGQRYFYKMPKGVTIIGVERGMGTGPWITVYHPNNYSQKRVKSPALPSCETAEEAQRHLDAFAISHNLEKAID